MRSRFTAHVLRDHAYLHRTYTETARRPFDPVQDEASDINWTRLVVHSHELGAKPDTAFVDFTAYYKHETGELPLHEKSEFIRTAGRWFFKRSVREGPAPVKAAPKVGRNDPCPCGSGKKYKHCCGK
jgi:SEC-C motif-containing protein